MWRRQHQQSVIIILIFVSLPICASFIPFHSYVWRFYQKSTSTSRVFCGWRFGFWESKEIISAWSDWMLNERLFMGDVLCGWEGGGFSIALAWCSTLVTLLCDVCRVNLLCFVSNRNDEVVCVLPPKKQKKDPYHQSVIVDSIHLYIYKLNLWKSLKLYYISLK